MVGTTKEFMSRHVFANFMWSIAKFIPRSQFTMSSVTTQSLSAPSRGSLLDARYWKVLRMKDETISSLLRDISIHAKQLGSQSDIEFLVIPCLSWYDVLANQVFAKEIIDFPQQFQLYASDQGVSDECTPIGNDLFQIFQTSFWPEPSYPFRDEILYYSVVAAFQEFRFDLLVYFGSRPAEDPCRTEWMFGYKNNTLRTGNRSFRTRRLEIIIHDVETLYNWQKRSLTVPWSRTLEDPNGKFPTKTHIGRLGRLFRYQEWHIAIIQGSLSDLQRLTKTHLRLQHVLAADILGWTPLHYAVVYHRNNVIENHVRVLQQWHQQLPKDEAGRTPMHYAVMYDYPIDIFLLQIDRVVYDWKDRCGMTPLHYAAKAGKVNAIKLMNNKHQLRGFSQDITGRTAYHWAAINGNVQVLEILTEKKWNIMTEDQNGDTPLHHAVRYGRFEAVKYLVFTERDHLLTKNKKNNTAEDESRLTKNLEIQTLLEKARVASSSGAEWDLFMWLLQWDY
jgi:hypothetical protein